MPAVTYDRVLPLASALLYDPGQADPQVTDWGFKWYDPLISSYQGAMISRTSAGELTLQYLEGIGIVCRPFINFQDTRLSNYTTSGGSWEERRPATAKYQRKYRLIQYNATANSTWYAQSAFSLPANPSVAFSFFPQDPPADTDFTVFPPYVRLEFGNGQWAIELHNQNGTRLLRLVDGTFQPVMDIGEGGGDANGERLIVMRCHRGKIGISTDRGDSYKWYSYPDGTSADVLASKFYLRGQSCAVIFGLHQIEYKTGTYTSAPRNMFTDRGLLSPSVLGRYATPTGTGVTFGNATSGQWAAYTVTLTPHATTTSFPWKFYDSPEVYAVKMTFACLRYITSLSHTTPWDGEFTEITVDKAYELSSSTCTIKIRKEAANQFTGNYRWRKVKVFLGGVFENGDEVLTPVFTGYIKDISCDQDEYNSSSVTINLENISIRARRQVYDDFTNGPLGGQTVNQALDEILDSMGLDSSYRSWNVLGDAYMLPAGKPEEPALWPKPGDEKFKLMQDVARYAGLEIAVTDDGIFSSGPLQYVDTLVSQTWEADPSSGSGNALYSVQKATYKFDSGEAYTAVLMRGTDAYENALFGYGVDYAAENDVTNYRFCPWREIYREEVEGTTTLPALMWQVAAKYNEYAALKFEGEITVPVNLDVLRRQRVKFEGLKVGIADTDEFAVLTIRHTYKADPSFASLETTLGIRRLGP